MTHSAPCTFKIPLDIPDTSEILKGNTVIKVRMPRVETKCIFVSHHQNEGHACNHGIEIANKFFNDMMKFKY
jgi:hypothetical protein